jgi:membrane protein DedA with SNARE-associated domain
MIATLHHWIAVHGYGVVFVLLALGIFGLPVPDEWLLAYLGHLVFKGKLIPAPTVAAAFFGSIFGMTVNYLLGRSFGLYVVHRFGHLVHITEDKLVKTHNWFEHAGRWGLMIGYFLPGIRHLTAFVAGTAKMSFTEFAFFAYAGGLIWCGSFITLGYVLEEHWSRGTRQFHDIMTAVSASIAALFAVYLAFKRLQKKRERQTG